MSSLMLRLLFACAAMAAAAGHAAPPELLWFSDVAPRRAKDAPKPAAEANAEKPAPATSRDSMDSVIGGDEGGLGGGAKRLWLRRGEEPGRAAYAEAALLAEGVTLLDGRGAMSWVGPPPSGGLALARCELPEMGFYNAYLSRETVRDGVLWVQLAKAELLNGTCCRKLDDVDPAVMRAFGNPGLPLEIVREHKPDEKLFTKLVSGDRVAFTVNRLGKPAAGARVTMLTQAGWRKTTVTDAAGRVEFTLIRDYFPDWNDFRRLTRETFVVVADLDAAEPGRRDGLDYATVRYQATLSGKYSPSPYDYKSYAWGLGIALFVLSFGGLGVYLFRRRRVKPFREARFHESA